MRRSLVLLSAGLTVLSAGLSTGPASAENNTPRNLILFIPDGLRALKVTPGDRPRNGRDPRQGRQFQELAFAVPDLHHGQRLGDVDRPLSRRYRRVLQHDLDQLHLGARRRHRGPLHRERRRARRHRRAFQGRLSQRGHDPEAGPRQGLQHRRDRQASARPISSTTPTSPKRPACIRSCSTMPPAARTAWRCRTRSRTR